MMFSVYTRCGPRFHCFISTGTTKQNQNILCSAPFCGPSLANEKGLPNQPLRRLSQVPWKNLMDTATDTIFRSRFWRMSICSAGSPIYKMGGGSLDFPSYQGKGNKQLSDSVCCVSASLRLSCQRSHGVNSLECMDPSCSRCFRDFTGNRPAGWFHSLDGSVMISVIFAGRVMVCAKL